MVAVIYNGTAFPIYWTPLATINNSTTKDRADFLEHLLLLQAEKGEKNAAVYAARCGEQRWS